MPFQDIKGEKKMEILLDTANIKDIERYNEIYNITGVTSNPTIISREKKDFFPTLLAIRKIIGDKQLHVQVTGRTTEEQLEEARKITEVLGSDTYIKVPTNEVGIKTMKILKAQGYKITATAIYTAQQAVKNGLVDKIGTLEDAVAHMREAYNLHDCDENELIYVNDDFFSSLFAKLSAAGSAAGSQNADGDLAALVHLMEKQNEMPIMYMSEIVK
jgi:ClpP class serine protease